MTTAAQWGEPSPAAVLAPRAMQMFEHAQATWDRTMGQAHATKRLLSACADEMITASLPVIHTELEGAAATLQELLACRRDECVLLVCSPRAARSLALLLSRSLAAAACCSPHVAVRPFARSLALSLSLLRASAQVPTL